MVTPTRVGDIADHAFVRAGVKGDHVHEPQREALRQLWHHAPAEAVSGE